VSDGPGGEAHLSLDALAELEEGIAGDTARLEGHLAGCSTCRARAGQLRASRALLSALPPVPMPADVAARIDAALAAEPTPPRAFVPGATIVPLLSRRHWWRGANVAAAAAAVAVVGLAAALVVGHGGSDSSGKGTAADSSRHVAPSAGSTLKQWQSGANYTTANRAALVTGLVVNAPPAFPQGPRPASHPQNAAGVSPTTGTTTPLALGAGPSYDQDALRHPAAVAACAAILAGKPVRAVAVDYASYDGAPAVVLVLPDLVHPDRTLAVYVIRSVCSDAAGDLLFFTVARPG
jgi:hypothetical protein